MDKGSVAEGSLIIRCPIHVVRLNNLISSGVLVRNTVWNLIGHGAPMLVAIFTIPMLIKGLGTDRFGILTLAWVMIGYFSLFDFGLGRALTQRVAEKLGAGLKDEIPALVWTSLFLMLVLGLVGALAVVLISPWLVYDILKIPEELRVETVQSFYLLAISIPIVTSTVGLRGILEAQQRFGLTNAVRISLGLFTFLGLLLVLPFSQNLLPLITILVVGRTVAWAVYLTMCFYVMPVLRHRVTFYRNVVGPLIRFGSWMTVTNIVSPLMVYMDRFLIGSLISITAVAYYTTPFEVITKLLIIPSAFVSVLFPAFSSAFSQDSHRAAHLYYRGTKYVFLLLFPMTLIMVTFAKELLLIWLGVEFAENGFRVMQFLAIGVLVNGVANVPFALLQGSGRPDITTKLNLLELPIYLASVWWLIHAYGIAGVAGAWLLRVTIDAVMLMMIARKFLPHRSHDHQTTFWIVLMLSGLTLGAFTLPVAIKIGFLTIFLLAFSWIVWTLLLDMDERRLISQKVRDYLAWQS